MNPSERVGLKDIVKKLDRAFNPRSVAVVGDKREMDYMWLKSLANFQGNVYSVQIDEAAPGRWRAGTDLAWLGVGAGGGSAVEMEAIIRARVV